MIEDILKNIVKEKKALDLNPMMIRNYLKEYLQYLVLYLLYNEKKWRKLVFKGGSCLRVCFGLPRLSEDLDFDYQEDKIGKNILLLLENFLRKEITKKYFPKLQTKIQSDIRIYLKFPILRSLGLSDRSQTDKLYVKIETSKEVSPFAKFILTPVSRFGFNFIVRSYDLSSLMSGKINAFLYRIWFRGKKNEIDIKGRDFYDLFWFFQKGVEPNWQMLRRMTGIKDRQELKKALLDRIKKSVTPQKLAYDLNNFIADRGFVDDFSKNYLEIMKNYL